MNLICIFWIVSWREVRNVCSFFFTLVYKAVEPGEIYTYKKKKTDFTDDFRAPPDESSVEKHKEKEQTFRTSSPVNIKKILLGYNNILIFGNIIVIWEIKQWLYENMVKMYSYFIKWRIRNEVVIKHKCPSEHSLSSSKATKGHFLSS